MQVWAVTLDENAAAAFQLYQRGLELVDADSRQRLQRFYHKIDSIRGLIGRLLPRMLLIQQGITPDGMTFGRTESGKPYISRQSMLQFPIGYNITHDSGLVAMAYDCSPGLYHDPPAYRIGVDVMKLQLPRRETFAGFVTIVNDQLTPLERNILLLPSLQETEALRRFYLIWTLKEAYTKALGLGLGFDFSRIEYDVPRNRVRIDGVVPQGWRFVRFQLAHSRSTGQDVYVGVAAEYTGGEQDGCVVEEGQPDAWLKVDDAVTFLEKALGT
ncbi:hypothetical protein POSPLADRAFT_1171435 [Postia placenta MAD-698-R-SB12]|uniref:holo-[acyl-carrier-protein] synthase n=1 Tax=Postia placenta MAD-698-R-SB12 TaxID=670580 RepID=A0A1X6MVH7_9APHY|nr:hypothetical protein POSPLADRAFT_1171435 [Postia placenta MAD-698-R-SB12]OSX60361.1 hypothetical protein POSPLADRAFT_1171435 [Postia placenta MAD-698-R-SB12]